MLHVSIRTVQYITLFCDLCSVAGTRLGMGRLPWRIIPEKKSEPFHYRINLSNSQRSKWTERTPPPSVKFLRNFPVFIFLPPGNGLRTLSWSANLPDIEFPLNISTITFRFPGQIFHSMYCSGAGAYSLRAALVPCAISRLEDHPPPPTFSGNFFFFAGKEVRLPKLTFKTYIIYYPIQFNKFPFLKRVSR